MGWKIQEEKGCSFFQYIDEPYIMRCSIDQDPAKFLDRNRPILVKQIHSTTIINIDKNIPSSGDGLYSRNRVNALGIKVADCLPVFIYNDTAMCAIHCGWRGILGGIARKVRALMQTYHYTLGACIEPQCYVVQKDVAMPFKEQYPEAVIVRGNRFLLDLKKAVISDLGKESLRASLELCTRCHPEYFFSYRRGDKGRRNYAVIRHRQ